MTQQIGPYTITREIGRGGMGVVYLARDTKLDRDVALKALPPEFSEDAERLARFDREAKLLASLNHPSILTIHDIGVADGVTYLVTELLEGESLSQRLDRGAVPARHVIDLSLMIAEGLAAAHERGIVHRDLKPDNVFLTTDGRCKVLDFGLARQVTVPSAIGSSDPTQLPVTQPGRVIGTPAYMSPEQARGEPVDERADVFALGCVMYEMATGRPAFHRASMAETLAAILHDQPPSPAVVESTVPSAIDRLVRRCLAKDPADRPASGREIVAALQQARSALTRSGIGTGIEEELPALAVLPFANISGDPENEYFSDGITEEIINALSHLEGMRVVARTSVFSLKGSNLDIREIGDRLSVTKVLEGSVRKSGNRFRINVQLVNIADGCQVWSDRIDGVLDDLFEAQDHIASTVVDRVQGVDRPSGPMVLRGTSSEQAYECLLKGRHAMLRTDPRTAAEYFRLSAEADAEFAAAHSGIADAYTTMGLLNLARPHDIMPGAREAAERALALDHRLASAYSSLGYISLIYDWDWALAEKHLLRALDLNPNDVMALDVYGHLYCGLATHQYEKGHKCCERAVSLDPIAQYSINSLVANLYAEGRIQRAMELVERTLRQSDWPFLRRLLGLLYFDEGRTEEASREMNQAVHSSGRHSWALMDMACIHAHCGRADEAEQILDELLVRSRQQYEQMASIAAVCFWLGRFDEAFEYCDRALEQRDGICVVTGGWPMIARFGYLPRYRAMLDRVGVRLSPRFRELSGVGAPGEGPS